MRVRRTARRAVSDLNRRGPRDPGNLSPEDLGQESQDKRKPVTWRSVSECLIVSQSVSDRYRGMRWPLVSVATYALRASAAIQFQDRRSRAAMSAICSPSVSVMYIDHVEDRSEASASGFDCLLLLFFMLLDSHRIY